MGIGTVHATFILYCMRFDLDFKNTATLGRQSLYLNRRDIVSLFKKFKVESDPSVIDGIFAETSLKDLKVGFADSLFKALGAETFDSVDASDYENASIIHDMNLKVPESLENRFSLLIDGGTLEHVFHFPTAIENCMRMVRKGGHFISIAPANNFFGHGFYQFSSELFYRIFTQENGFKINQAFLCSEKSAGTWYEIADPASIHERIALSNQIPTFQLFVAEKIRADAGLHVLPQQSDYQGILWEKGEADTWTSHGDSRTNAQLARNRKFAELLPRQISELLRELRPLIKGSVSSPFNNAHLRRFRV